MSIYLVAVLMHIVFASIKAIYLRTISLEKDKYHIAIALYVFKVVAISGVIFSLLGLGGLPDLPNAVEFIRILIIGLSIPIAWYLQLKIIEAIGANNWVPISALAMVGVSGVGIIFLAEDFSNEYLLGLVLILLAVFLVSTINPDKKRTLKITKIRLLLIVSAYFIGTALGLSLEKQNIDSMGLYHYIFYGLIAQFVGMILVKKVYFADHSAKLPRKIKSKATILSALYVAAAAPYLIAISTGSLSHTMALIIAKVVLTFFLAAIILKETNQLSKRLLALALTILGIIFIL